MRSFLEDVSYQRLVNIKIHEREPDVYNDVVAKHGWTTTTVQREMMESTGIAFGKHDSYSYPVMCLSR